MIEQAIQIDFNYYWHAGTGSGSGTHLDAITEKDNDYLPFVSGRHLRGLLRHALHRAEVWQWFTESCPKGPAKNWETLIFGSANQSGDRSHTLSGMLFVNDAIMATHEQQWLNAHPDAKPFLYQELYATAIELKTGSAKAHSLRGIEVCLPVQLQAALTLSITATDPLHRQQQQQFLTETSPFFWLAPSLSLIDAVGAHRTRGLGEARLSVVSTTT
jgi:hypothetical protein